jgi:hypothetical protein
MRHTPAVTAKRTVPRFAERVSAAPPTAETLVRGDVLAIGGKLVGKAASEYLVEALEMAGVKRVCGVVGDSLNGFTECAAGKKINRPDSHAA